MSRNRGSTTVKWAPSALTGETFTIPTSDDGSTINVVIKPTTLITSATLIWPDKAPDRQTVRIACTGVISLITNQMGTNSGNVANQIQTALAALAAGGRGAWWYDDADAMWYRYT